MENVVTQNEGRRFPAQKVFRDQECLGNACRVFLDSVGQVQAPAVSLAEDALERAQVSRCAYDQNVANAASISVVSG